MSRNPQLDGLVGITMWFKPPTHEKLPPEEKWNLPHDFSQIFASDLVKAGLVSDSRWDKRNATQVGKAVREAGIASYEALRAQNPSKLAAKSGLTGVKASILHAAMTRLKTNEGTPEEALSKSVTI